MNNIYFKGNERIFVTERYDHIEQELNELEGLLKYRASKKIIQAKYKELKNWFKDEYRETQKSQKEYIGQWYAPLVVDIYIQSFSVANTNACISKIELALYNALDYFHIYKNRFNQQ